MNSEIFVPHKLFCDVGKTQATVLVSSNADLRDNVNGFIDRPCEGCKRWSQAKIKRTEAEIKSESLAQFGSDAENITGIRDDRINQLEQLLVDLARFKGGEHKLVVGLCTPISSDIEV